MELRMKWQMNLLLVGFSGVYMIKDCDLAGFNSDRFDIPLLAEELLRAGVDFDMKNSVSVDVQTIFIKKSEH
jgi:DNA polymerase-3 subunit epsilon